MEFLKNRSMKGVPPTIEALDEELQSYKVELEAFKKKDEEQKEREERDQKEQQARDELTRRKSKVQFDPKNPETKEVSGENFGTLDADGDGRISRDEWRSWADAEIVFLEQANKDKQEIMSENRRLRQALKKPTPAQQETLLQTQDLEMAELNDRAVEVKLIQDQLEAELAISMT